MKNKRYNSETFLTKLKKYFMLDDNEEYNENKQHTLQLDKSIEQAKSLGVSLKTATVPEKLGYCTIVTIENTSENTLVTMNYRLVLHLAIHGTVEEDHVITVYPKTVQEHIFRTPLRPTSIEVLL